MNLPQVEAIARAVLYEGYNLYPYRPSALKNRQRWTFGGVFPRDWAARGGGDRSLMQTQCLLRGGPDTILQIRARFLHIVAREIGELPEPITEMPAGSEPASRQVARFEIEGAAYLEWEEATEREIVAPSATMGALGAAPATIAFAFPAERTIEPIRAADGKIAALIIRMTKPLAGEVSVSAQPVAGNAYRVTVRIANATPLPEAETLGREAAQRSAFASTHILLGVTDGAFVSMTDAPAELEEEVAACRNDGAWPVLVGAEGQTDTMLSSPIILYDYPRIAPESPGDLFDGCEIDEILILRILTLTEEEKREMAAADPRTRALLQRTEALAPEALAGLHGTFRDPRNGAPLSADTALRVGDRVRLKPKAGGDMMDVVLKDQVAVIEAVERDFDNRIHVAVTVLDDPGRDLGLARMPGHRFFFAPDELEPLGDGASA